MKFSCGLTYEAKKRKWRAEWDRLFSGGKWQKAFAWLPRHIETVDGVKRCIWLGTFEYRYSENEYLDMKKGWSYTVECRFLTKP